MSHWCLEVWGDYACFTRPEMKVERVSYDVMTPSAARAIFEAILWKPAIKWHITKIEVINPIRWISVRRNEVGKIMSTPTQQQMEGVLKAPLGLYIEDERQQRAGLFLKDVRYRLHGYFEFLPVNQRKHNQPSFEYCSDEQEKLEVERSDEKEAKYAAMFERRATKGQCFHRPYLGCREFPCYFKLLTGRDFFDNEPTKLTRDLGYMLYDMDYSKDKDNPEALFFRAKLENGIMNTDRKEVEVRG